MPYGQQLLQKQGAVEQAMRQAGIEAKVEACVGSDPNFGSRNKAKMVVGGNTAHPKLGLIDENLRVRDLTACPLLLPSMLPLLRVLRDGISRHGLKPYAVPERTGELKFCILRQSESTKETMLRFVAKSRQDEAGYRKLASELQKQFPELKVVTLNVQPIHQAILEGPEEYVLSEKSVIQEQMGDVRLFISPQSFTQVTSNVALKLYQTVAKIAAAKTARKVLDVYCGGGAFSLFLASQAESVLGIERSKQAVGDAILSAELNKFANTSFIATDVEAWLQTQPDLQFDFVVVNPPRRGLEAGLRKYLVNLGAATIVYSSCNPETLARDLKDLGVVYEIERIEPFDMFPLTDHVETLVTLKRRAE
jgi:23S rRNA (uracil747-C5)-methyltransferase